MLVGRVGFAVGCPNTQSSIIRIEMQDVSQNTRV